MASTQPAAGSAEHVSLLVVGGGPAGRSAAAAYREHGGTGRVLMLSADTALPYFRPALSKEYLRGETELTDIGLAERGEYEQAGIEVRLDHPVASVRAARHEALTGDGSTISYGSCVLATGGQPAVLSLPGATDQRVRYLRSVRDAESLRAAARRSERVVVIGSGFIGCEAAASLAAQGLQVTMVSQEPLPQQNRLGEHAAQHIAGWLDELGVRLVGGVTVTAIEDGTRVRLEGYAPVAGDLVLAAAGVEPVLPPVEDDEFRLEQGRALVSASMRTDLPDLYVAGDAAYAYNASARRHLIVEHWGEAETMGEIAGTCCTGQAAQWDQVPGFWTDIGSRSLQYAAWGDGYDNIRFAEHADGAFTAWYLADDRVVGVLTHQADEDYEHGSELIKSGAAAPSVSAPRGTRR
jgi:3-phenylpropionate/trans-cinnamate dioxygenase ferredoxin reductase component